MSSLLFLLIFLLRLLAILLVKLKLVVEFTFIYYYNGCLLRKILFEDLLLMLLRTF